MMAQGTDHRRLFMATDMVTIPITIKGQVIFALGAGDSYRSDSFKGRLSGRGLLFDFIDEQHHTTD